MATFLDPTEGIDSIHPALRPLAISMIRQNLLNMQPKNIESKNQSEDPPKKVSRFLKFNEQSICTEYAKEHDSCIENLIKDYTRLTAGNSYECALKFLKVNQNTWPQLAELAKKVLGVPATSASVEGIFNLSGHIFSAKRRRLGMKLFERLVFLKLNEKFL